MRRLAIAVTLAAATLSLTAANAQDWYVGVGAKKMMLDWCGANPGHAPAADGISFLVGARSDHFAGEVSVQNDFSPFNKHTVGGALSVNNLSVRSVGLDGLVFARFGEMGWFQPFVTVGVGYSSAKERTVDRWVTIKTGVDGTPEGTKHKLVTPIFSSGEVTWRAGIGVEARLARSYSLRFTALYEPYDLSGRGNGAASFGLHVIAAL
jgi:opacity protein-like surface antigen